MLMRVRERDNEVEIHFSGLGGRQHAVLAVISGTDADAAFDRNKLESLRVRARADAMSIRLRAKDGERFDVSELYRSLRRSLIERPLRPLPA